MISRKIKTLFFYEKYQFFTDQQNANLETNDDLWKKQRAMFNPGFHRKLNI
jgi:hypothetical protein